MNKRKSFILCFVCVVFLSVTAFGASKPVEVENPSGSLKAVVRVNASGQLEYNLNAGGTAVVEWSPMGILVENVNLGAGVEIAGSDFSSIDETFKTRGDHNIGKHKCNTADIKLQQAVSGTEWRLELRVCEDGAAYRYVVPGVGIRNISGESSSWKFPGKSLLWCQTNVNNYEDEYKSAVTILAGTKIGMPLTVELPGGGFAAVTESNVTGYSGMTLSADDNGVYHSEFLDDPSGWNIEGEIRSPWRVVIWSRDLTGLVNADIVEALAPPPSPELDGAEWIVPGRCLWSWLNGGRQSVTPEKMREYVDAAEKLGYEYLLVDDGWEDSPPVWKEMKGWSAPGKTSMDIMAGLVEYAAKKNMKIWVWKHFELLKDPGYRQKYFGDLGRIGVAGVKVDFMDSESQEMLGFYEETTRDAASNRLMINFHGANKPTGESRTWPNEMAREGIRGLEYFINSQTHLTALPFTRLLAGHADYTPVHLQRQWMSGTTWPNQIASGIIFTSPVTFFGAYPPDLLSSPARPLFEAMPVLWDETIVLDSSVIGNVSAFARRSGDIWFVAVMNGGGGRKIDMPLNFLAPGNYEIQAFVDDIRDPVSLKAIKKNISAGEVVPVRMRSLGGFAAMITPIK